jgi:hypothetical protein
MGLDLIFNRKAALDAGILIQDIPNDGAYDQDDDLDYIEWCRDSSECIQVPGTDHWISNDTSGPNIMVRANKWGDNYTPLTKWLKQNDIKWEEL